MPKIKLPTMLSYTRSLEPTIGYFYGFNTDTGADASQLEPVLLQNIKLRATMGDYSQLKNIDKSISRPNPQEIETAILPAGTNALQVRFSLTVAANSHQPNACIEPVWHDYLRRFSKAYAQVNGYQVLAERYAINLASGCWLWRNLSLSRDLIIEVRIGDKMLSFGPRGEYLSKDQFGKDIDKIDDITQTIVAGLTERRNPTHIHVTAKLNLCEGETVYPSQEFSEKDSKGPSCILSSVSLKNGGRQAIYHSQKIGNALRHIDTWYEKDGIDYPIAVEPFGVDQNLSKAWRVEGKNHLYELMEKHLIEWTEKLESGSGLDSLPGDVHYVMACFVRGGVFGAKQ